VGKEGIEMTRPTWNDIWIDLATKLSERSVDSKTRVGCVIVTEDNTQVLAVGYNGDEKGGPNKRASEEDGGSGFIHAEINALIKMDYNNPKNKVMYTTVSPCPVCAKSIINAGIVRVVFDEIFRDDSGIKILERSGIEVIKLGS